MSFSVTMPALGESVTEGTVTRWLKQEGDRVEVDEPLLEVSTDKVDTEIPSPAAGVLTRIVVGEDSTVEVGAELAVIGDEAEASGGGQPSGEPAQAEQQAPQASQPEAAPEPQPAAAPTGSPDGSASQGGSGSSDGSGGSGGGTPVAMPALGESVTEGTVTRWLKQVGESVGVDEPLLEVSTDKVDTEIPSPAAGVLTEILVQEDQTVEVGTTLAVIGGGAGGGGGNAQPEAVQAPSEGAGVPQQQASAESGSGLADEASQQQQAAQQAEQRTSQPAQQAAGQPASAAQAAPAAPPAPAAPQPTARPEAHEPAGAPAAQAPEPGQPAPPRPATPSTPTAGAAPSNRDDGEATGDVAAYVTPLVRKLAAEHGVDLSSVSGTGVGGRVRKQDVLEAAARQKEAAAQPADRVPATSPASPAASPGSPAAIAKEPAPVVSPLRGTTEKMSRLRTVIAKRMVESLAVSAQLTTVVEADITRIARLRDRAKRDFEAREGVKLSFLPFFAKAAVEALKAHPKLNASIDTEKGEITYFDAENLGVAVDTDRGLLVPVVKDAGDLNIAGLARKIADLAERTRTNKIAPDELGGGTFTLTNTGSRGALFDTPIINQPQVAILGTGTVVKRPVVVDDPDLGETIAVRSMVFLALTYDHRLVDGADAARFLTAVKQRLEEANFESDLGL